ncbi:MAG: hypothetical protein ACXV5B_08900 [Halobacteriota archaeon]
MTSPVTYELLSIAIILNGFLAGLNIDRGLVQMPAWRKTGVRAWAAYSRHADLGNAKYLYPTEAIVGALFTVAAAVSFYFDLTAPASAADPIYASVALAVGGLLTTLKAGPFMLSLRRIGEDASALQKAFEGFRRWGNVRGVCQILAFLVNIWAFVALAHVH